MNYLRQTALKTIKRESLIAEGDTIIVGVSGGADSVALLHFLCGIKSDYNLNIKVCHVNHKIRKSGTAERDAQFVEKLCNQLGVEFFLKEIDIPSIAKEQKQSEELVGREERYKFFNEIAGSNGKIATAHNKNDNVETVLMRLVRGTGLNGLSGIPYKRGNIIRPILDVEREDIENYLRDEHLDHIVDETNFETNYTRNKVRLQLIPLIKDEFNKNVINSIGGMISSYSEDNDFIDKQADEAICDVVTKDNSINISKFNKLHKAVRNRVVLKSIKNVLNDSSVCIAKKTIDEVLHLADGCHTSVVRIGKGYCASFRDGFIVFLNDECHISAEPSLLEPVTVKKGVIKLPNNIKIKVDTVDANNVVCNERVQYVPLSMCNNLVFRKKVIGDRFLAQPGMHQKIKKFNEYMLCKGGEVLWIPGKKAMRLSSRSGTFMKFEIIEN